jgi:hypothetical protein
VLKNAFDLLEIAFFSFLILVSSFPPIYLQALIQFPDSETASSARNALDGRSIPRHALLSFPNLQ